MDLVTRTAVAAGRVPNGLFQLGETTSWQTKLKTDTLIT